MIKIEKSRCPECDEPAAEVEETMLAWTSLSFGGSDEFDWGGWTEPDYDTNEPLRHSDQVLVRCVNKHQWESAFLEANEDEGGRRRHIPISEANTPTGINALCSAEYLSQVQFGVLIGCRIDEHELELLPKALGYQDLCGG